MVILRGKFRKHHGEGRVRTVFASIPTDDLARIDNSTLALLYQCMPD